MQEKWKLREIWQKGTFMRSCAKIFTRNGRKRRLKAVMQKYSQEIAGKHCFREVVLKYSCPATQRGRIPEKKYYSGWCGNIHFKINIHSWIVFHKTNYLCTGQAIHLPQLNKSFLLYSTLDCWSCAAHIFQLGSWSSSILGMVDNWIKLSWCSTGLFWTYFPCILFSWSSNMSNSVQLQYCTNSEQNVVHYEI